MNHSFAVVGLLLALYCTLPFAAIGGPCDIIFNSAKAMCEAGFIKDNCEEIEQGIEGFTKLVQGAQSKICALPTSFLIFCKICKASEPGSSKLENAGNGTASAGNETIAAPVIRSYPILESIKSYTNEA